MKRFNFIFSRNGGGDISANLAVREDGFVRAHGVEMDPAVVQVGDVIQTSPSPASGNTVVEIVVEEMED